MVKTSGLRVPAKYCRRSRLPRRKKGLLWRLLAGLRLLLVLLLWVSTSAASCVRVINSITARSTTFSRMPGIVSAQQTTAPEFNSSPTHSGLLARLRHTSARVGLFFLLQERFCGQLFDSP